MSPHVLVGQMGVGQVGVGQMGVGQVGYPKCPDTKIYKHNIFSNHINILGTDAVSQVYKRDGQSIFDI